MRITRHIFLSCPLWSLSPSLPPSLNLSCLHTYLSIYVEQLLPFIFRQTFEVLQVQDKDRDLGGKEGEKEGEDHR